MDAPEKFLYFTSTGWTAIGSIVSAFSIAVLSVFNFFTLVAVRKQAQAAEKSLTLMREQMAMSERPFVAIDAKYDEMLEATTVDAVNQGSGPALDVHAYLDFKPGAESGQVEYAVGCLTKEGRFRFLIGRDSALLQEAIFKYKSISGQRWRTAVVLFGGSTVKTEVSIDTSDPDEWQTAFAMPKSSKDRGGSKS